MIRPIARYTPSRRYALFALAALLAVVPSAWASTHWGMAWIASAILFGLTALLTLLLALRPRIAVFDTHLTVGRRTIPWDHIRSVDRVSVTSAVPQALSLAALGPCFHSLDHLHEYFFEFLCVGIEPLPEVFECQALFFGAADGVMSPPGR